MALTPTALISLLFLFRLIFVSLGHAQEGAFFPDMEWDGHLKIYSRILFPKSDSAYQYVGLSPNYDGVGELRLNSNFFFSDALYVEINYEGAAGGGDTRKDGEKLKTRYPELFPDGLSGPIRDDHRFFNLTHSLHEGERSFIYHRLDRAFLSFSPAWGEIRIGRQALTWGHGFTFNPMDLFNPFAPTDLVRDYKTGDDLILVHIPVKRVDMDLIYAAHRDPDTDKAGMDQSSLGVKLHTILGGLDADVMVARHYKDMVAGIGTAGTLKDAAFRLDLTGTCLDQTSRGHSFYISGVANLDYSWVWFNRNWYGYVELYYNGLSNNDYGRELLDPAVSTRLERGELFALGRWYASANVNLEIHPLVNAYLTPVINLHDGSGMLLPRVVYDFSDTIRITLAARLNWGAADTEYGGFVVPGADFTTAPADTISAWLTWYF